MPAAWRPGRPATVCGSPVEPLRRRRRRWSSACRTGRSARPGCVIARGCARRAAVRTGNVLGVRSASVWRDVMPRAVRRTAWRWHPVCDRACRRLAKESAIRQKQLVKGVSRNQWARWLEEGVSVVRSRNLIKVCQRGTWRPERAHQKRRSADSAMQRVVHSFRC